MILKIKKTLDKLVEYFLALLMVGIVVSVFWQVFTRFVINNSSSWTEEVARFMMIWIGFLGAAVGLRYGMHMSIVFIVNKVSNKICRKAVDIFIIIITMCIGIVLLFYGYKYMVTGQDRASMALQINMSYIYAVVPISGIITILNSLESIYLRLTDRRIEEDITIEIQE